MNPLTLEWVDKIEGIQFVINQRGEKTAVQIDLQKYGEVWEDIYDTIVAQERADEPRETLETVRQKLIELGKLNE